MTRVIFLSVMHSSIYTLLSLLHQEHQQALPAIGKSVMSTLTNSDGQQSSRGSLIGPLISKLPVFLQGRILTSASETLEKGKWWKPSGANK